MKKMKLARFFAFYTVKVIAIPVLIGFCAIAFFIVALQAGVLLPANYEQQLLTEVTQTIAQAEVITAEMLPTPVEYLLLNKEGTDIIDFGNMRKSARQDALEYAENGKWPFGIDNPVFTVIESKNAICVARYSIIAKFSSPKLQRWLPYPEMTLLFISASLFIILLILLSKYTSKKMRYELQKLLKSTEKIKQQDLDFVSEIHEFHEFYLVADSLDRLRDALKLSIAEQISLEKNKIEQINALAHDIKIPVTIIKGNAELLSMRHQNEKEQEFTKDILYASNQIELYTQTLIEFSRLSVPLELNKQPVLLHDFLQEIEREADALARLNQCTMVISNLLPEDMIMTIDYSLIYRGLMNILVNGIEHTPILDQLKMAVNKDENDNIIFEVQDAGDGFSQEALEKGCDIFFTEDTARTGAHHGIGLSFAKQVTLAHGGSLSICNTPIGGQVRFTIPIEV